MKFEVTYQKREYTDHLSFRYIAETFVCDVKDVNEAYQLAIEKGHDARKYIKMNVVETEECLPIDAAPTKFYFCKYPHPLYPNYYKPTRSPYYLLDFNGNKYFFEYTENNNYYIELCLALSPHTVFEYKGISINEILDEMENDGLVIENWNNA